MARSASRTRVATHRAQLRAKGLRPIQIWVPDTRAPGFAEECRRQCLLLAEAGNIDRDVDAWVEANNQGLAAELDELEG
jgi:hypothetical protein